MLSENIRSYRKKMSLSQDDLAEKIGVSRQSVSFWETGQTQPTLDNIIALAKVFQVPTDVLLGNADSSVVSQEKTPNNSGKKKTKTGLIIAIAVATLVLIGLVLLAFILRDKDPNENPTGNGENSTTVSDLPDATTTDVPFDLFSYCKRFAIEQGQLNGDYCIYQQPATTYGGYEGEYFSISYWSDSDMVEFCLHCPLSETQSHNFYLRMRGGYDGKYEYCSSKYFRDSGESLRIASGYIDPAVFSDTYPIPCDSYVGSADGQTEFMEESRVGICDLIRCLKEFVTIENMDCDFSDFDFVNF